MKHKTWNHTNQLFLPHHIKITSFSYTLLICDFDFLITYSSFRIQIIDIDCSSKGWHISLCIIERSHSLTSSPISSQKCLKYWEMTEFMVVNKSFPKPFLLTALILSQLLLAVFLKMPGSFYSFSRKHLPNVQVWRIIVCQSIISLSKDNVPWWHLRSFRRKARIIISLKEWKEHLRQRAVKDRNALKCVVSCGACIYTILSEAQDN